MKKVVFGILIFLCAAQSAVAFDWGGLFNNTSKLSTSDFSSVSVYQSNGISLWASHSLSRNMRLSGEVLYKYELDVTSDDSSFTNIIDLTLLKFYGSWAAGRGVLQANAGRFSYSDLSAVVFSQISDGAYISFQNNTLKVGFYGGYTGLINALNVSMVDINPDATGQLYSLCPGYVPCLLDFSLLNLAGNYVGLQAGYFVPTADYLKGTFYGTLCANGYLGPAVSYSLSAVVGSQEFSNVMLFAKGNLSFYIGQNFIVNAGAEYASGENGGLSSFKTVTSRAAYNGKFFYETSGVIIPQASALFVHDNLVLSLGEKAVFTCPENSVEFTGLDTSLNFVCNVLSDLQVGCNIVAYAGINDVAMNSNYYISLNVSLTF